MSPAQLSSTVVDALASLVDAGRISLPDGVPAQVAVESPRDRSHGDWATNVALRLAREAGTDPRALGEQLAEALRTADGVTGVDVAGPGFLNITVAPAARGQVAADVVVAGAAWGSSDLLAGVRVDLGLLPDGGGQPRAAAARAAVVRDVLARLLVAAGARTVGETDRRDPAALVGLADLAGSIGADAARWALLRSPGDAVPDLDPETWLRRTDANPLFVVQHAHARAGALLRNAADLGLVPDADVDLSLLGQEPEGRLLRALAGLPQVVASAAELRAPHRVVRHLEELARHHHCFLDSCRVLPVGEEQAGDLHRARLLLVDATRTALANGLGLLGVSAPERM